MLDNWNNIFFNGMICQVAFTYLELTQVLNKSILAISKKYFSGLGKL